MKKSHVSRPKPQFERVEKPFRDASLILIASEGEKTEYQYFSFPFLSHRRVKILPIPSSEGNSAPNHVLENLKKAAKNFDLGKDDCLWLAIDKDKWTPHQIANVSGKRIKNFNINVAVSNPCFELWLLIHIVSMPSEPIKTSKAMESRLRKALGSYRKENLNEADYKEKEDFAIQEAKKTILEADGIPRNPGTQVYRILEDIQKLLQREDSLPCN